MKDYEGIEDDGGQEILDVNDVYFEFVSFEWSLFCGILFFQASRNT